MTVSRRARHEWRIVLWVSVVAAAVSAWFGVRVGPADDWWLRSAAHGVVTSLMISTPILFLLTKGDRLALLQRLKRAPLVVYFAGRVLIYFVVIVGGLLLARLILSNDV